MTRNSRKKRAQNARDLLAAVDALNAAVAEAKAKADAYPESVGEFLQAILQPEPAAGPPYTHTFSYPPTEYDDDGNPLPQPIQPTMTVYSVADRGESAP